MRAHILENGIVVNTIEVDSMDVMPNLVDATEGSIGWSYSDGVFLPPATLDEEKAKEIRLERGRLLSQSDWATTRAVDQNAADGLGIQVPQVWLDYRQALRDITAQEGFPNTITWPAKPE